jgi:hypothetical protein
MSVVTEADLARALAIARRDFECCGLYTVALANVPVRLTDIGEAYGYFSERGEIEVPAWSWSRLLEQHVGRACTLEDVLRHELAHALADQHMHLVDTPRFADVFGAAYWDEWLEDVAFDPLQYVSEYATTAPCEDYAETVMVYARHRGRVSRFAARPGVMRAFRWVADLACRLGPYRRLPPPSLPRATLARKARRRARVAARNGCKGDR